MTFAAGLSVPSEATSFSLDDLAIQINELFDDADQADKAAEEYRTEATASEAKAESHRVQAGKLLLAARRRIDTRGSNMSWAEWCRGINRSERDIRRLLKNAKADDPDAAHQAEKQKTRKQVKRSRADIRDGRMSASPTDPAREDRPIAPVATIRRDDNGQVLDPIPVVLKRAVVRLTRANELDRQIRKKLADAVATLEHMARGGQADLAFAEDMRAAHSLVDRAQQHRDGVIQEIGAILTEIGGPTTEPQPEPARWSGPEGQGTIADDQGWIGTVPPCICSANFGICKLAGCMFIGRCLQPDRSMTQPDSDARGWGGQRMAAS